MTFPSEFRCHPGGGSRGFGGNAGGMGQTGIPTNGVVEGAGEPPAGSRETANTARPRTPSISSVACACPAGSRPTEIGVTSVEHPELVGPVRPRRGRVGQHDHAGVLGVRHDDGHPAAAGQLARAQRRVRRRQHRLDAVGLLLGRGDGGPLGRRAAAPARHRSSPPRPHAEHADDGGRRGEPAPAGHRRRRPRAGARSGAAGGWRPRGRAPARASAAAARTRTPSASRVAVSRYSATSSGARLALGEVTVERDALEVVHRVERVRAAEGVDVRARHAVTSTLRQSRRRIRPSRIRVLTVGRAASSSVETSR